MAPHGNFTVIAFLLITLLLLLLLLRYFRRKWYFLNSTSPIWDSNETQFETPQPTVHLCSVDQIPREGSHEATTTLWAKVFQLKNYTFGNDIWAWLHFQETYMEAKFCKEYQHLDWESGHLSNKIWNCKKFIDIPKNSKDMYIVYANILIGVIGVDLIWRSSIEPLQELLVD